MTVLKNMPIKSHLGDYQNTNWLPSLMARLGRTILDPSCDHALLLEYHPRLIQAYKTCLSDLQCSEHTFIDSCTWFSGRQTRALKTEGSGESFVEHPEKLKSVSPKTIKSEERSEKL